MRHYFFKTLALFIFTGTTLVAISDMAHSVGQSRMVWTSVDDFINASGLADMTELRLYLLINTKMEAFQLIDCFLWQAPLIAASGILAGICYLASYRPYKND